MRVISGKYRSLNINTPRGRDVRPTTDRVREAMFSSIESLSGGLDGAIVLDAFAGSGALGIEALSRGAEYVEFCEKERNTIANIKDNLERLHVPHTNYALLNIDSLSPSVVRRLQASSKNFNLVLLDPPYAISQDVVSNYIDTIANLLENNCLIVYEHAFDKLQSFHNDNFVVVKSKVYGQIQIDYIRKH